MSLSLNIKNHLVKSNIFLHLKCTPGNKTHCVKTERLEVRVVDRKGIGASSSMLQNCIRMRRGVGLEEHGEDVVWKSSLLPFSFPNISYIFVCRYVCVCATAYVWGQKTTHGNWHSPLTKQAKGLQSWWQALSYAEPSLQSHFFSISFQRDLTVFLKKGKGPMEKEKIW